ncbi:MAG: 50S ribosomal protein L6 [Tepidisphaeraceae bacterium]
MSRLGKKPVPIASGAKVNITKDAINVEGSKGKLSFGLLPGISVKVDDAKKEIVVERKGEDRQAKAWHGLTRAYIANMLVGVTAGYKKTLEMRGVGYKAEMKGKNLALSVGFANQIVVAIPQGLTVKVEPGTGDITNKITVEGIDKQQVGDFAANVRKVRKPEPYKGKGIRYEGETVKIKPGKAFAGTGK